MFALIVSIILGLIALTGIGYAIFGPKPTEATGGRYSSDYTPGRPATRWVGAVVAAVALLLGGGVLIGSMYTPVGTSDEAIVTSFGHVDGNPLGPGIHWTAPWQNTTIWDHSKQRTSFEGKDCLHVRLFGGQTACLPTQIQWQAVPSAADQQFRLYRTFLRMQAAYMSANTLVGFFNTQFENFNPVQVASLQASGAKGGTSVSALVRNVADAMRQAYTGQINIERVTVGTPDYDNYIDSQLNKVVGAKAGLEVAQINEQTAQAEATAAKNLTTGGHLTPLTLLQTCLDTVKALAQAGEATSQTFNCNLFGGGSNASILLNK
jgi:SPFH domain / Band 7 family